MLLYRDDGRSRGHEHGNRAELTTLDHVPFSRGLAGQPAFGIYFA
jgi:hypothetical protein